jgi:PilZ domain
MKFDGQLEGREIASRGARIPVRYDALVQCELGEIKAQILNVSGKGFRLLSSCALEPGASVSVKVGKLEPVGATIRWANGLEAGGVFLDSIAL